MKGLASLRARIFFGAVLWTAGLFSGAVIISTLLMMRYRHYPAILHGTTYDHAAFFSMFAALCMVVGLMQVRSGLSSVNRLRARLADVRDGRDRRVDGRYPVEVQPLVDDLNALLNQREQAIARALAKAGDLAHGLKTPLAILAQEADRARHAGQIELADAITQQVERMRRQTDYHLAHARAAASGAATGARCLVQESAVALVRTMQRLHAERGLTFEERVAADHAVRCQREDLDEMLGNLLDNACKWARARVAIHTARVVSSPGGSAPPDPPARSLTGAPFAPLRSRGSLAALAHATPVDSVVEISIEDDGPGLPMSLREAVLQRGVRADEAAPGSGLGLAIVRDLAELYEGSISLDSSPSGGLRARLTLPSG